MSWVVLAIAAPILAAVGAGIWKIGSRVLGRAIRTTWVEAVAEAVQPQFAAVHDKLDDFRIENEKDHAKVRVRLDGMDLRLDAIERRIHETGPVQVHVTSTGAQGVPGIQGVQGVQGETGQQGEHG